MKPFTEQQVDHWTQECKSANLRVGYTCGAFDILHAGHVDYLEKARGLCDRLLVAVNSDRSVRTYKSPHRPINPELERMMVIGSLRCVDAVTLLDELRPLSQLQRWQPSLYIKGGDYKTTSLRSADAVRSYGGEVALIPLTHSTSTTSVIERVLASETHIVPEVIERPVRPIVFLDRDGTLIPDFGFLHNPSKVELLPGVGEGLARLQQLGFRLIIVTNQQGIGLGYYSEDDFIKVNQALFRLLAPFGVKIDRVVYCPHSFAEDCSCRKPEPRLLLQAMEYYKVSPDICYMIGDRASDVEAGEKAGCRSILVGQTDVSSQSSHATSFSEAVNWIVASKSKDLVTPV